MNAPKSPSSPVKGPPSADPHPSGDPRFKMLDTTLKKNRFQPDALIEVLHNAQGLFGYLSEDVLLYVAHALKLPPSRVYGVATFYHFFTLEPRGAHSCSVCMGTACYVKGAGAILNAAEEAAGIHAGMTTQQEEVSLSTARCLGACGIAPAVVFDGVVAGHETPESTVEKIQKWLVEHGCK
jgi:bidirectional [NiFe] hydrogenase diaphorase subunit